MKRDWFTPPTLEGFYIVDTRKTPLIVDGDKPFLVVERYYGGYRVGMTYAYHGYYTDLKTAKRRIRYLETK